MLKGVLIFVAIALVLANGEPVPRSPRNGEFNRYYLYNRIAHQKQLSLSPSDPEPDLLDGITVVVVHGHGENYLISLNPEIIREILATEEEANVITVDWAIYASLDYATASTAVLNIGEYLAQFITNNDIDISKLHLVGFDLGAHIVGIAGRRLSGRVARITGLDPSASPSVLSNTDALYVEVIHTDASGTVLSNGIGTKLGHADFYPNGGRVQPGCANNQCHHERAYLYFAASIRDNTFTANCCNTVQEKDANTCRGSNFLLGTNVLRKYPCASGIYRVNTLAVYPY